MKGGLVTSPLFSSLHQAAANWIPKASDYGAEMP
jgi:hypothetical protein